MSSSDAFTEQTQRVLAFAKEEAQRFQHNYIGTEHLLLGLLKVEDGIAAKALIQLGIQLNVVRSAVEFIIGRGDYVILGEIGLTPRAKKVIALATDEARLLGHHYISTEHILLGLVREGEGIAAGVLESQGLSMDRVRTQVTQMLEQVIENMPTVDLLMSEQAQQIVTLAQEEARYFRHGMVRTEHLLAALLRQNESDAVRVLHSLGIDLISIHHSIEFALGYGEESVAGELALSPLAKEVMEGATQEVRHLKQEKVMPLHILLALISHDECVGAGLLEILVGNLAQVRAQILSGFSSSFDEPQPQEESPGMVSPWRTEVEINDRRQQYLTQCLHFALAFSDPSATATYLKGAMTNLERILHEKVQAIGNQRYDLAATLREYEVQLRDHISHLGAINETRQQMAQGDIYPFKDVKLKRADIEWLLATHEDSCGPVDWHNASQHERVGLDLRGADLRDADLHELPLTRMLGGKLWTATAAIHLEGADLRGAHLERANLFWAHLEKANLAGAYLQEANLTAAHLYEANLSGALLQGANLSEAHLEKADLSAAHLEKANLSWAYLEDANLHEAHLTDVKFLQMVLQRVDLSNVHPQ